MVRDLGISQNFSFDLSPSTETDQNFRKFHGLLSLFPQMAIINFPFTQKVVKVEGKKRQTEENFPIIFNNSMETETEIEVR